MSRDIRGKAIEWIYTQIFHNRAMIAEVEEEQKAMHSPEIEKAKHAYQQQIELLEWLSDAALNAPPERRAHWIYDDDTPDENGNLHAVCSECYAGEVHAADKRGKVPYCWKCGRRMDRESENVETGGERLLEWADKPCV